MHGRLCVSALQQRESARWPAGPALGRRRGLPLAILALLGVGTTASCEAVWGGLSVPTAENCVLHASSCSADQVCDPVVQICAAPVTLTQLDPVRGRTDLESPVTITGTNFVPEMVVKWNGTTLSSVIFDSPTQLRVTAPRSLDGSWRATIEVSNPRGGRASRSDLFSYYSPAVTFQVTQPTGPRLGGIFALRVVPADRTGRALIVVPDSDQYLRGFALNNDGSTFASQWSVLSPANPLFLLPGDLNGDGIRDIMVGAASGFYWHPGNPDGTFQPYLALHSELSQRQSLALGDFDKDGHADLVGIHQGNKQLALLGNGGTAYSPLSTPSGYTIQNVVSGEFDGQPGDDLAFTYADAIAPVGLIVGGARLGTYNDVITNPCNAGQLQAGNFGGGTNQALVLTCPDRVEVLQAIGGGAFTTLFNWPIDMVMQKVIGGHLLLADFDGDGDLDAVGVLASKSIAGSAELWLLENTDGRGTLKTSRLMGSVAAGAMSSVDVGDLNDDGKPDVVIGDYSNTMPSQVTVLLNRSL